MSAQLLLVLVLSEKVAEGCFPPFIPPPGPPGPTTDPPGSCGHCKPEIPRRCQGCSCCNIRDCMLRDLSNKVGCTAEGCQSTCAVPCEKDPFCPFPKPPPGPPGPTTGPTIDCGHCKRRCEGCTCCNDQDCWLRDLRNKIGCDDKGRCHSADGCRGHGEPPPDCGHCERRCEGCPCCDDMDCMLRDLRNKVGCSRDANNPGCKSTDGCRGRGRGGGRGGGQGGGRGGGCCTTKGEESYCMSCVSGYTCQDDVMRCEPALAMYAGGSSQMPAHYMQFVPGLGQNFMRAQGGCIHSCGWGKKK